MSVKYSYVKDQNLSLDQITLKIKNSSSIDTDIDHINFTRPNLDISFVSSLSTPEENALDSIINGFSISSIGKENFHVQTFTNNNLEKEEWFDVDNGDGTYSGKCREIEYEFKGRKIVKYFEREYLLDGELITEQEFRYFTQSDGNILVLKKI